MSEVSQPKGYEKCYGCNGRGYTSSENHPACPLCNGEGWTVIKEVSRDQD